MMHSETNTSTSLDKSRLTIYQMSAAALMTALFCVLGPMSIPIGPIPISFTNLVFYLTVYLLGTKLGTISYLVYLLLGTAGLPVFSGYSGGLAKLAGPTGGYLVGFILMGIVSGIAIKKCHGKPLFSILGMAAGTVIAYLFGTVWYSIEASCSVWAALCACVFPFLLGDAVKILLAAQIGPLIRKALQKAHLLENL